jgi:hypothetical protein
MTRLCTHSIPQYPLPHLKEKWMAPQAAKIYTNRQVELSRVVKMAEEIHLYIHRGLSW